jgi:hypothetical protein
MFPKRLQWIEDEDIAIDVEDDGAGGGGATRW